MDVPVVIAGAGPVGLSLAVGLGHHGVPSLVLEQKPALSRHSKAPGVLPRTQEIFRAWGLLDRFLSRGEYVAQPQIWVPGETTPRVTIDLAVLAAETACAGLLVIPQDRTEAILHQRAVEGPAEVRFGHRLGGFEATSEGVAVRVEREGGSTYTVRSEFLVGCDGPRSTVRHQLGWELEGATYPTRLMLADVELPDARNDLPWPRLVPNHVGILVALRIEPRLWRIIATVPTELPDAEAVATRHVSAHVAALFGPGPFEPVWADTFRIHCRTSPRFRQGRVFLAGDAAHINSPAGGQGMNSGIQDAHNLAWKLARARGTAPAEPLLASFEAERRPAILTNVDRYTDLLTRAFLLSPRPVRNGLAALASRVAALPAVFRRVTRRAAMLDTRYRDSPVLHGRGRWLGARAPDGPLRRADGEMLRLLDLAARDAALLLFDDGRLPRWRLRDVEGILHDVAGLGIHRLSPSGSGGGSGSSDTEPALIDVSGGIWEAWRPGPGGVALVRPDGHVGWIGTRPSSLELRDAVGRALGAPAQG
jgi:2-polyprenyl-6-methoxyphenol hydroxylase-like FAD-dependent oxidoreductase